MDDISCYLIQNFELKFKVETIDNKIREIYSTNYGIDIILYDDANYKWRYTTTTDEFNIDTTHLVRILKKLQKTPDILKIKPKEIKKLEYIINTKAVHHPFILGGWHLNRHDFSIIYDQFNMHIDKNKKGDKIKKYNILYPNNDNKTVNYIDLICGISKYLGIKIIN
jgi:hypothetical protein